MSFETFPTPRQITFDARNHDLDNNQNFTRDGEWLIYDTRNPGIDSSQAIEKVHIKTGETVVLYGTAKGGEGPVAGAGAASFSPKDDRVAFIHGPWKRTGLPYDFTRRRGGLVRGEDGGGFAFADARDITPPFTPGALRGGTHRHEWDGSGQWLGYTYNDDVMKKQGQDLRTIGVTRLGHPVQVENAQDHLFEGSGEGFSALVVAVTPDPKPGSDEIQRAAQDSWVGLEGYLRADGKSQLARAFVGSCKSKSGEVLDEVFIVDIPADITQPGPLGPLEGTETSFPAPPAGCAQKRLTHTGDRPLPGVAGTCWSSPDGEWITFLAGDDSGMQQIFAIDPEGKHLHQVTALPEGVACSPRWTADGKWLAAVSKQGQLFVCAAPGQPGALQTAKAFFLTPACPSEKAPLKPIWSPDGKQIAYNQPVNLEGKDYAQVFVVDVPPLTK
ncbi:MAG: hypothetical protein AMXMBFR75_10580 [Candidatus Hinthialibacteria bacterium]